MHRTQLKDINIKQEKSGDKNALGTPDFRVFATDLTLGCIENKRVNAPLQALIDEANKNENAQVARYLRLCNNLILTDYLNFWRVIKNDKGKVQITQKIQLCTLNELKNLTNPKTAKHEGTKTLLQSKEKELLAFFKTFFSSTPKPINRLKEFTDALALRSYFLKQFLFKAQENDPTFYQSNIQGLYDMFKRLIYKELKFEDFCDSFAQTLTYSLFIAKLNNDKGEKITLDNVKNFISTSFPLIRAMSGFLQVLNENHSTKWLIVEILNIINNINITSLIKELNKINEKDLFLALHKDPFIHIYEPFLQQYDPKMKELRGVYYTPYPVVSFIINAIDLVLKNDFKCENALANALDENSPITLLDFATGGKFCVFSKVSILQPL